MKKALLFYCRPFRPFFIFPRLSARPFVGSISIQGAVTVADSLITWPGNGVLPPVSRQYVILTRPFDNEMARTLQFAVDDVNAANILGFFLFLAACHIIFFDSREVPENGMGWLIF